MGRARWHPRLPAQSRKQVSSVGWVMERATHRTGRLARVCSFQRRLFVVFSDRVNLETCDKALQNEGQMKPTVGSSLDAIDWQHKILKVSYPGNHKARQV